MRRHAMPKEDETQISAYVSKSTKEALDMYCRETGLKKGYVIERALQRHIETSDELPESMTIPTEVVLTRESSIEVLKSLESDEPPTQALIDLMARKHLKHGD
jgi:hypothetical protein